jgi:hypothetical protein
MAEIINLRRVRKQKAKAEKEARAAENRSAFGRTKGERHFDEARKNLADRRLEGHKLDNKEPE